MLTASARFNSLESGLDSIKASNSSIKRTIHYYLSFSHIIPDCYSYRTTPEPNDSAKNREPLEPEELGYYSEFKIALQSTFEYSDLLRDANDSMKSHQNVNQTEEAQYERVRLERAFFNLKEISDNNLSLLIPVWPPSSMEDLHDEWLELLQIVKTAQSPQELVSQNPSFLIAYRKFEEEFGNRPRQLLENGGIIVQFKPRMIPAKVSLDTQSWEFDLKFHPSLSTAIGSFNVTTKPPEKYGTITRLIFKYGEKIRYVTLARGFEFFEISSPRGCQVNISIKETEDPRMVVEVLPCDSQSEIPTDEPSSTLEQPIERKSTNNIILPKEIMLPEEAVENYYQLINQGKYQTTWSKLTSSFKKNKLQNSYDDYEKFWKTVNLVKIHDLQLITNNNNTAIVYAKLQYFMRSGKSKYDENGYIALVRDTENGGWLIESKQKSEIAAAESVLTLAQPNETQTTNNLISPKEAVEEYYQLINEGKYRITWSKLTRDFKKNKLKNNYDDYEKFWKSVNLVKIHDVQLIKNNGDTAIVYAKLQYFRKNDNFHDPNGYITLVRDTENGRWLIKSKGQSY